jgi:hypothetical protein
MWGYTYDTDNRDNHKVLFYKLSKRRLTCMKFRSTKQPSPLYVTEWDEYLVASSRVATDTERRMFGLGPAKITKGPNIPLAVISLVPLALYLAPAAVRAVKNLFQTKPHYKPWIFK